MTFGHQHQQAELGNRNYEARQKDSKTLLSIYGRFHNQQMSVDGGGGLNNWSRR